MFSFYLLNFCETIQITVKEFFQTSNWTIKLVLSYFIDLDSSKLIGASGDVARPWQLSFQDPATKIAEGMFTFHNCIMTFLVGVTIFVLFMLFTLIIKFKYNPIKKEKASNFVKFLSLEIWYIIIPTYILYCIAIPSFLLLYALDDISPITYNNIKVIGHQWYWSYEFSDYLTSNNLDLDSKPITFDSYMLETDSLTLGDLRLLEVDNSLFVPINLDIKLLVSSMDVLHCWTVPSFGIKVDACPGRLTKAILNVKREGIFYGQCSEICGTNHGFMPIRVVAVKPSIFYAWIFQNCDPISRLTLSPKAISII